MHWALLQYLPDVANCKTNFTTTVASYISAIHKKLKSEVDGIVPGETPVRKRTSTQTPRRKGNNPAIQSTVAFSKELVSGELSQLLFA